MIARIWVYLSATPLLWLTATLAAYEAGAWIFGRFGRRPLLNPVLIAVTVLIAVLAATGTPYETYFDGAQFVHFLLGPATVALAVPLFENRAHVRAALLPMLAALAVGSLTAIVSAVAIARLLGARGETLASMAPKSVTTPIAMAISEQIGGLPSLTAAFVIATARQADHQRRHIQGLSATAAPRSWHCRPWYSSSAARPGNLPWPEQTEHRA